MKYLSIALFVVFFGCQSGRNGTDESKVEGLSADSLVDVGATNEDFERYLSAIPFLELPFETKCGVDYEGNPDVEESLARKFNKDNLLRPYRRIKTGQGFEIVMFLAPADEVVPIIKTYRSSGDEISSHQLMNSYCGGEPGYYGVEYTTLNKDLTIQHLDSTWTSEVDSLYNEIEGTKKLQVTRYKFQVLEDGQIVRVHSKANAIAIDDSLIEPFEYWDEFNPANPDLHFVAVKQFDIDLNFNGNPDNITLLKLKEIGGDPGDFHQIRIRMDDGYESTETNFTGWVRFDHNYSVPDEVKESNKLDTDLLLLTDFSGTRMIGLFSWVYSSEPGLLTFIEFSSGRPRVMINRQCDLTSMKSETIVMQYFGLECYVRIYNNRLIKTCTGSLPGATEVPKHEIDEYGTLFIYKNSEIKQRLGINWVNDNQVEFRLITEDQLCDTDYWGSATRSYDTATPFVGTDESLKADVYVVDKASYSMEIKIARSEGMAEIVYRDKSGEETDCIPSSNLVLVK